MKVTLRQVTPADQPHLLKVYAGTREDELAMTDWDAARKDSFVRQQFTAQDQYYRANYANASYDVVLADGRPAGRLYVARWPDEIRIMDIALLPKMRGKGVGSTVLRRLQAEARELGLPLRIHVERFNPALSLYMRLGFQLVEDRGVYLFLQWTPEPSAGPSGSPRGRQENTAS
ncbi:MAG: GNAT family N-acetyltransferase [Chloroflexota bacterium]